ncbi:MAG: outer membrane protein transport protein [Holophaga sp.]
MARRHLASLRITTLGLLLAAAAAPRAAASGFQLRDQSGSGQGVAYAGISAGGSDISSMFFNPAALGRYDGNHLQLGLTDIAPTSKLSDGSATRSAVPPLGIAATPISGATSTGNVAKGAVIPTLYAMWSVDEDLRLGISVNVPFGLTTEYDPSWAGRYRAIKSHLETLDIAPCVAYKLDPQWTVGFALVARQAKAVLSQAVDLGAQGQVGVVSAGLNNTIPGGGPIVAGGAADATATVSGSSWAYGYRLGILCEPASAWHLGLGYQSAIKETIKGNAVFNVPASTQAALAAGNAALKMVNPPGAAGTIDALSAALARGLTNTSASAVLHMPATISLGGIYDVSPTFSLAAEVAQTRWSTFHELRVQFANPAAQPDVVDPENWKDSWFFSVGGTCHPEGPWTYRLGVALDQTPVPDATRTPRIPDSDRTWVSLGVGYQFTKAFGVDAGYSHLFCKNATVNLQAGSNPANPAYFDGNLTGTYKNSIDILAVQARFAF